MIAVSAKQEFHASLSDGFSSQVFVPNTVSTEQTETNASCGQMLYMAVSTDHCQADHLTTLNTTAKPQIGAENNINKISELGQSQSRHTSARKRS